MPHITINAEGCKACMLCIDFCPRKSISLGEHLNSRGYHPAEFIKDAGCTGCRICATMCPDVCIEVFRDVRPASATSETESEAQS